MSLDTMIWASLGALPALAIALLAARVKGIHPGVKTWVLRIAILKAPLALGTGFVATKAPAQFQGFGVEPLLFWFVVGLWLTGTTLVLAHGLKAYRAAWELEHKTQRVFEPGLSKRLGLSAYRVIGLNEPCLVGLVKPRLLVPDGEATGEIALRHEIAHLRHGDLWFQAAMWLALALFWFVPGMGLAIKEHSLAQEMWADACARKDLGVAPGTQANDLLRASTHAVECRAAVLGYGGAADSVRRRIEAMYQKRFSLGYAIVGGLAILIAATPVKAQPETSAFSPARLKVAPIAAPVSI